MQHEGSAIPPWQSRPVSDGSCASHHGHLRIDRSNEVSSSNQPCVRLRFAAGQALSCHIMQLCRSTIMLRPV